MSKFDISLLGEDSRWFKENGMMSPYGENGVLFTTEYCILKGRSDETIALGKKAMEKVFRGDHFDSGEPHFSHDNLTAVFCLSSFLGDDKHKRSWIKKNYWAYLHPRDFIFYHLMNERWYSPFFWLLYPIALGAMMHSCWSNVKVRNGNRILKTDGKLLTWIRCRAFGLKWTGRICSWVIRKNPEFGNWKKVFEVYFKDPEHPNRNFPEKYYDL